MGREVVVGSLNTDHTVTVARLPAPGETVIGQGYALALGGKGANQAIAAARQGADVVMVGCVGDDDDGDALVQALRRCSPQGLAETKRLTARAGLAALDAGADEMRALSGRLFASEEAREGMASFLQKRPPRWAPGAS